LKIHSGGENNISSKMPTNGNVVSTRVIAIICIIICVFFCYCYLSYFNTCLGSQRVTTIAPLPNGGGVIDQETAISHSFTISSEWLNLTESKAYADYGDNDCPMSSHYSMLKMIFTKWANISKEHEIPYFLNFGTLLGAWRNMDMIPTDSDIDLVVDIHDTPKLLQVGTRDGFRMFVQPDWKLPEDQRKRFNCAGKQVESQSDSCAFIEPGARLIHLRTGWRLDIYSCNILYETLRIFNDYKEAIKKDLVFPLKHCKFMEVDSFCPNKPMKVLETYYNNLKPKEICKKGKWTKP